MIGKMTVMRMMVDHRNVSPNEGVVFSVETWPRRGEVVRAFSSLTIEKIVRYTTTLTRHAHSRVLRDK